MADPASPKYVQLSEAVEEGIRGGRFKSGRVPGVRSIARAHGVSVVTAARALQVLRDKGLITAVERSGCYVAGAAGPTAERFALCLRVTPGPFQQVSGSVTRRGFEAVARANGLALECDALDPTAGGAELLRRARRAAGEGVKGLFLMPSRVSEAELRRDERLLAACRAAGLPVVLIERNLRGTGRPLKQDLVGLDDVNGAAQLTRHLLDRGCQRVGCVVASPISTHEDRVAGYLYALHAAGAAARRAPGPLVLRERTDLTRKAAYSRLADELIAAGADGVVCYNDYTAVGLIVELFARGVRVPHDFAVAGFDDLPIGNQFAVGVTTYALPAELIARQAVHVMRERRRDPDAPPVRVVVPGRLIVRESSGG